ncbi:MAG: TlyA family RNA methyltransferase [Eubacteriales bacterium]|nr:TlyA family RNA methyltransferase [Eubacteriales bacterium]
MKKERIDVLLVEQGFFKSRERAKASLMAGSVFVDGQLVDKAGTKVPLDCDIQVKEDDCPYVSRGGYKLKKAIDTFGLDLTGFTCADIGASTGGFTDVMLQSGAVKVYSVDVGYGQLDWKLRNDPRVVNIERCNVRYMDTSIIGDPVDLVSIDVSFISLKMIFPVIVKILKDGGTCVSLVKPQFEAGREEVSKGKGVIHDLSVRKAMIMNAAGYASDNGLSVRGVTYSPVRGAKGNVEFLLLLEKTGEKMTEEKAAEIEAWAEKAVAESHEDLEKSSSAK